MGREFLMKYGYHPIIHQDKLINMIIGLIKVIVEQNLRKVYRTKIINIKNKQPKNSKKVHYRRKSQTKLMKPRN